MSDGPAWTDLLDPDEAQVRAATPVHLGPQIARELARAADPEGATRPTLLSAGNYIFGILLAPLFDRDRDVLVYQEIDLVITRDSIVTVRKTPPGYPPFDLSGVRESCEAHGHVHPGMVAFHLVDEVAERYLDLLDDVDDEIDELEEHVDDWTPERVRVQLSELRHDLLHIRRTLSPTRDAVRRVVDGRVDIAQGQVQREVFPDDVERAFSGVLDKLLRSSESLEFSRDLLGAVRDYQQNKVANDQNEVTKRLTAIAAILLFPTFVVGVYGQNFDHMPELHWRLGYAYSWAVIVVVTIAQVVYFRRKRWL
jgi:magnesium transporter